jgi:hypothetical protein
MVNLKFYALHSGSAADTTVYRLTVTGFPPPDSNEYIHRNKSKVSTFQLPMDHTEDMSTFILTFTIPDSIHTTLPVIDTTYVNDTMHIDTTTRDTIIVEFPTFNDTISFIYRRDLHLIDPECGFGYNFRLNSIIHTTQSIIKFIEIIDSTVTSEDHENIKLYL